MFFKLVGALLGVLRVEKSHGDMREFHAFYLRLPALFGAGVFGRS